MAYTPDPHLIFTQSPATDARLVFGAGDAPVSARATLGLAVQLPALRVAMGIGYDNRVQRGPSLVRVSDWQVASSAQIDARAHHAQAPSLPADRQTAWQIGALVEAGASIAIRTLRPCRADKTGRWQRGAKVEAHRRWAWALLVAKPAMRAAPWQIGLCAHHAASAPWRELDHSKRASVRSRWQAGTPLSASAKDRAGVARALVRDWLARWQTGIPPRPGRRWVDPVIPPANPCYTPSTRLVLKGAVAAAARLVFACDTSIDPARPTKIIPVRRVYLVINEVTLVRVDNAHPLSCLSLDVAVDAESWTCAWSAELAPSEFDALRASRGEPVELLAHINGQAFSLLIEGAPKRSRQFGKATVQVSGRGVSAWLDEPYAEVASRSNEQALTAQQLMAAALELNGVSLGWALDWQIDDWLVPAGAWSHQGSPIAAVLEIAGSVGAIVQSSRTGKSLSIFPRYPAAPWAWAETTPDIQIPLSIAASDAIEPVVKPAYNAVYVSGQSQGVVGYVRRTGTAGDRPAALVTHPLITHADAARQRGLAVLGDTGRQERISMSLPLSDDTGLIRLNMLAEVPDPDGAWRGLVRSAAISARWSDGAGLAVWQQIGLERHYAD